MPYNTHMLSVTKPQRIALGLSGGVDSAVAAALLQQAGHDVTAVYIECWHELGCRAEQDRKDALSVALQLGLPFQVLDFKTAYSEKVMQYFLDEYQAGRTPNPDVLCNSVIKFGLFYDWALTQGFDAVATGHYAKLGAAVVSDQTVACALLTAADSHKDQTYFLHRIRTEQLQHILFPLGDVEKSAVRAMAHTLQLPVADKKDSVGICFVGDINVRAFLHERLGEKPGAIVDKNGLQVGTHKGLWFYTVGQRHGFSIDAHAAKKSALHIDPNNPQPLYVIEKRAASSELVVGVEDDTKTTKFTLTDVQLTVACLDLAGLEKCTGLHVRVRHTGELLACSVKKTGDAKLQVTTEKPVFAIAAGQSGVLYLANLLEDGRENPTMVCLGGGVFE